jgi:cell division protein ZapA
MIRSFYFYSKILASLFLDSYNIQFKTQFAGKDMQDFIAMVMIWYATQGVQESNPAVEKAIADALLKMELQIDKVL